MIPTIEEIARQLAVMVELYPDKTTSEIAFDLGFSPLFIINAITKAEEMHLLTVDKENDKLYTKEAVFYGDGLGFGADLTRIQDEILYVVTNTNRESHDIEINNFYYSWLKGIRPVVIDMAIHILKEIGFVVGYKLNDPYDSKSEYEFLTLRINEGKLWGAKQFKPKPKGKSKVSKKKAK